MNGVNPRWQHAGVEIRPVRHDPAIHHDDLRWHALSNAERFELWQRTERGKDGQTGMATRKSEREIDRKVATQVKPGARRAAGHRLSAAIFVTVAILVPIVGQLAPSTYHKPLAPNSVQWGHASSPCASDGGTAMLTATDSAGPYTIYQAVCNDGAQVTEAH